MASVGEIIRLTMRYSGPAASEMQNIFHYVVDVADTTDTDVLDTLEAWSVADWWGAWNNLAAVGVTLEDASVDVVNVNGTVVRAIGSFLIGLAGLEPGSVASAAVSGYILLKTLFPKVRGIKYLPGVAESVIQDGEFNAAGIATLAFCLIQYADTLPAAGSTELIPGVPSTSKATFVPFLDTGIVESIPAYQRRRKPNVGS